MANMLGNWYLTRLQRPPVNSLNQNYAYSNSKNQYNVIVCRGASSNFSISNLYVAQMQADESFTLLGENTLERLFKYNTFNFALLNVAFSSDRVYAVAMGAGQTGATNTGVQFFKLDTDGRYALLTAPTGTLSMSYYCDISPDGTFAVGYSATSPYLEFYSRSGDTWSVLSATVNIVAPGSAQKLTKLFNSSNLVYIGNNSGSGAAFQVLTYDAANSRFTTASPTGLGSTSFPGISWTTNGYYASTGLSSPYLKLWKSANGIDFTDISAGIDSIQASQHYTTSWDPTNTYMVAIVNNGTYPFIMYKRSGDTLTRLTTAFNELPTSALVTSRNSITWSKDSKYLCIAGASGTTTPYGVWMYRREGDNFYHIGQSYYLSAAAAYVDYKNPFNQANQTINHVEFI